MIIKRSKDNDFVDTIIIFNTNNNIFYNDIQKIYNDDINSKVFNKFIQIFNYYNFFPMN